MIGATVKSHFSLIGKRSLVWNPNLMVMSFMWQCNISVIFQVLRLCPYRANDGYPSTSGFTAR